MTQDEKRKIWLRFDKLQIAVEEKWQGPIRYALAVQLQAFFRFAREHGLPAAVSQLSVIVSPDPVRSVLVRLYQEESTRYANIMYAGIRERYGEEMGVSKAFGLNPTWLEMIRNFLLTYGARKVTSISETTIEWITKYVEKAVENGWGVERMAREMQMDGITLKRARLIARTESVAAMNYGSDMAARQSGLMMEKIWLAADDNRTRHSHRQVDDEQVGMEQRFSNGLRWPGDPEGAREEVINCRCTVAHEAKRDQNGRIIRMPVAARAA